MANRKLSKAIKSFSNQKQQVIIPIQGVLGLPLNGTKLVEVPNRKGFVYVRLRDNTSEVIQAYNSEVSTIYGLAVLVARQNNIYKVIGRDQDRYRDWGNIPYLPKHGGQHSFNPALGMGADITWVYSPQFMPMLGYPSGTDGGNNLIVAPNLLRDLNGNWKYVGNTGTPNITQYRPSTGAIMVLVYVDSVSGNPYLLVGSGTVFSSSLTGTNEIAPYIPQVTNPAWIPDTAVRLTTGTTQIFWGNVYDARPFFNPIPTGSTGGGTVNPPVTGSFVVQDEGITLGSATALNVVGTLADISLAGGVARLFVTGTPTPNGALVEDLTSQVTGTRTHFVLSNSVSSNGILLLYNGLAQEYGVHFLVSGTFIDTLFIPVTGSTLQAVEMGVYSTGSSISMAIQDEGVSKGTATTLNFVGQGVVASVAGLTANIQVSGTPEFSPALAFGRAFVDTGNYITGSTTFVNVDITRMSVTLILNQPHRCLLVVDANSVCTTSSNMQLDLSIDGVRQGGTYGLSVGGGASANQNTPLSFSYHTPNQLSSGSHTFRLMYRTDGGSMTLYATSGVTPLIMSVAEQYL